MCQAKKTSTEIKQRKLKPRAACNGNSSSVRTFRRFFDSLVAAAIQALQREMNILNFAKNYHPSFSVHK